MFTLKNILILIIKNAIICLIVISISLMGILIISKKIESLSNAKTINNKTNLESEKKVYISDSFEKYTKILGTNYNKIENAFVLSDNILEFINTLENLTDMNTTKQIYAFETPVETNIKAPFVVSTILYSNTFSTNVLNFSNYLKNFEKLPYFTKIEKFTISSQDKNGWSGISNISFNAVLYTKTIE